MITQPQVQRYATESGLRDIMIAEKEVVQIGRAHV